MEGGKKLLQSLGKYSKVQGSPSYHKALDLLSNQQRTVTLQNPLKV